MLKTFAAASMLALTASCATTRTAATETEAALCRIWIDSLPTRSRSDTARTQDEITHAYATAPLACPAFAQSIPG